MGTYVERSWWTGRRSVSYEAYVPDEIANVDVRISSPTMTAVADAERAVERLQHTAQEAGMEGVGTLLLRTEGLGSSRVEGLSISHKRLVQSMFAPSASDPLARSVLDNIRSMEQAVELGASGEALTRESILAMHDTLLSSTPDASHYGGKLRTEAGWIGGNSPLTANYVPPPETEVPRLIADLCRFMERRDLPPILQAAIAHVQFEAIHPFADGNGRIGRCLIHVILKRRGSIASIVPPVSTVFAANKDRYVAGLTLYLKGDAEAWYEQFADATVVACQRATALAAELVRARLGWIYEVHPRRGSTAHRLLDRIMTQPVFDVASVQHDLGVSFEAANNAMAQLESVGVVRQVALSKTRRVWMAADIPQLLDAFEKQMEDTPLQPVQPGRMPAHTD